MGPSAILRVQRQSQLTTRRAGSLLPTRVFASPPPVRDDVLRQRALFSGFFAFLDQIGSPLHQ